MTKKSKQQKIEQKNVDDGVDIEDVKLVHSEAPPEVPNDEQKKRKFSIPAMLPQEPEKIDLTNLAKK